MKTVKVMAKGIEVASGVMKSEGSINPEMFRRHLFSLESIALLGENQMPRAVYVAIVEAKNYYQQVERIWRFEDDNG